MTRPEHRIDRSKPHLVTTPAPSATAVPRRIMVIYGTRPEAIKVAPLIRALDESPLFTALPAVTAQHRSMLDQVNEVFGITPDYDLDIHQPGQTLTGITTRALTGVQRLLAEQRPDAVLVQGDTTTVFAAALAAF
jgi:UDP-N-acetylglucosamine 2-epimerase (non-hydrolysing)